MGLRYVIGYDECQHDREYDLNDRRPARSVHECNENGENNPDDTAPGDVAESGHETVEERCMVSAKPLEGGIVEPSSGFEKLSEHRTREI